MKSLKSFCSRIVTMAGRREVVLICFRRFTKDTVSWQCESSRIVTMDTVTRRRKAVSMTEHLFTASQQQIDLAEVEYDSTDQCFQDIELINSVDIEVCFLFKLHIYENLYILYAYIYLNISNEIKNKINNVFQKKKNQHSSVLGSKPPLKITLSVYPFVRPPNHMSVRP